MRTGVEGLRRVDASGAPGWMGGWLVAGGWWMDGWHLGGWWVTDEGWLVGEMVDSTWDSGGFNDDENFWSAIMVFLMLKCW